MKNGLRIDCWNFSVLNELEKFLKDAPPTSSPSKFLKDAPPTSSPSKISYQKEEEMEVLTDASISLDVDALEPDASATLPTFNLKTKTLQRLRTRKKV